VKFIKGSDFADSWRSVVKVSSNLVTDLSVLPKESDQLRDFVVRHGFLTSSLADQLTLINQSLSGLNQSIGMIRDEAALAYSGRREDVAKRSAFVLQQKKELFQKFDPDGLRYVRDSLMNLVATRHAEKVRGALAVLSLNYWNCRPFSTWIFAVPGWYESILDSCELAREELIDGDVSPDLVLEASTGRDDC